MPSPFKSRYIFVALLFLITIFLPAYADCGGEPIARLTNFTGIVLIKSRGEWGIKPETNLSLYSQDKVVTRIGTATITFSDGAIIEIKNNSNLLIHEMEMEEGVIKKVKIVHRRILLFLGKMFFKTGTGQVQTQFATEKTVIGIRGTAGILSIGADGQVYITFTAGGAKKTLGNLVFGMEAEDVPTREIDQHPIQMASYQAFDWYLRCLEAKQKAAEGKIPPVQALWACAVYKKMAAQVDKICARTLIDNNPHPDIVKRAIEDDSDGDKRYEDAINEEEYALKNGAIAETFEYQPPGEEGPIGEGYWEPIMDEGRNESDPKAETPTAGNEEEIPIDDSEYAGSQVPK